MIERYTKCTHYVDIHIMDKTLDISFECGKVEVLIKDVTIIMQYKIDDEDWTIIYDDLIESNTYEVETKIKSLDERISDEAKEDIKKFLKYLEKDDEVIINVLDETLQEGELNVLTEGKLLEKFAASIRENLNDYCYQDIS